MKTHNRNPLSLDFLSSKPRAAARVLQGMTAEQAAPYLETVPARLCAPILQAMETWPAARILDRLSTEQNAGVFTQLPYQTAAGLLRLQGEERRRRLLELLPGKLASSLRRSLAYREDTVGAWMDLSTPTFRPQLPSTECLALLQRSGQPSGRDLMIVDEQHRVVGMLPLDRLVANSREHHLLSALMDSPATTLPAEMSLAVASRLPAWHQHTRLPVRTARGNYLGTLDHATLQAAANRRQAPPEPVQSLAWVLGQSIVATLGGLMALFGPPGPGSSRRDG